MIAWVPLNRPEKHNALNTELLSELKASFETKARVLVLYGEGKSFCAGADMHDFNAEAIADVLQSLYQLPIPTIAAVHGAAIAGGCGLMSCCDFVIAAEGTKIGCPEVKRGIVPSMILEILRHQVTEKHLNELLLAGNYISVERAFEIGLVNEVVDEASLKQRAEERANELLECAPETFAKTKERIHRSVVLESLQTAEMQEGIDAFFEGRKPKWMP